MRGSTVILLSAIATLAGCSDTASSDRFRYDKAGRFAGCSDTWTYDGDPAYAQPQPAEDGDC